MKTLYSAIDQTVPGTKGGSVHVTAVAEGLAALGHDVSATEGREKLGLGLKAMRVLGIPSPRGPALEPGAEAGKVPRTAED